MGDGSLSQFEGYGKVNIQSDEAPDVLNPCLPQNLIVNHLSKTFNCSAVNRWCIAPHIPHFAEECTTGVRFSSEEWSS
jgi:hypothetical protein